MRIKTTKARDRRGTSPPDGAQIKHAIPPTQNQDVPAKRSKPGKMSRGISEGFQDMDYAKKDSASNEAKKDAPICRGNWEVFNIINHLWKQKIKVGEGGGKKRAKNTRNI